LGRETMKALDAIRRFYNSSARLMKMAFALRERNPRSRVGVLFFPTLGRSLLFSIGYPPPPFRCKILKTRELFYDYVLDL
jgi:hypothetical protein